jgi:hypothetical protein
MAMLVPVASLHAQTQEQDRPGTDPSATMNTPEGAESASPVSMDEPERQDLSFKLPVGQVIEVDNRYGSVFLRFGGYEHQLDLRATVQQPKGAPRIAFTPGSDGQRFLVAPKLPEGVGLAEGQRIDLILYVPQGHAVKARTVDGNIESRGLKSDVDFASTSGNVIARGTEGTTQAETDDGRIQIMLRDAPPAASSQRFATRTGDIIIGVSDALDAEVRMSTSGLFVTEYSLTVEHIDNEEPNKRAVATVGRPKTGKEAAQVMLESLRGDLKLWRRAVFMEADSTPQAEQLRQY